MKRLIGLVWLPFVFAAAVTFGGGASEAKGVSKIRVGVPPFQDMSSVVVGVEKGIFKEVGLEVDIVPLQWETGLMAVAGGSVEFAGNADADLITKIDTVKNVVFTNLLYLWEASYIALQKGSDLKTYKDFKAEGKSNTEAAKSALSQLKGRAILTATGTALDDWLKRLFAWAGVNWDTDIAPFVIDMENEEGVVAFIRGEGDALSYGIPQMQKLKQLGYDFIIMQQDIPLGTAVSHNGFLANRDYAKKNFNTVVRFQAGLFNTLDWIDKNKMEAFTIISDYLNKRVAAGMTPEALRDYYWNVIEYFPLAQEALDLTIKETGSRYWKARWDNLIKSSYDSKIISSKPDASEYCLWKEVFEQYVKQYKPNLK